jgi:hypothetical protein
MWRYWKKLAFLAVFIVAALVGWRFWPEDLFFPPLQPAATTARAPVLIGEAVHISKPHGRIAFTECIIAADPNRPERLFASSMYWRDPGSTSIVGYLSDDGGATWATSLELVADQKIKEHLGDPTAVFGPDGELYFVHMRTNERRREELRLPSGGMPLGLDSGTLDWLCLPAGATTWETRGRIYRDIDRPWLAVDTSNGLHRGRLYCAGNISAPYFITSADGGRTFQFPVVHAPGGNPYLAQPVVLSDGSLVAAFRSLRNGQFAWEPQYMPTFRSEDGGRTLTAGTSVSNWKHPRLKPTFQTTQGPTFPQMAVDPGSPRFADNLYIVWAQGFDNRRTTEWILFSRSTDRGKSWSAPVNLSEQFDTEDVVLDYLAYIPCVAVNNAGVVAVTWYDRRGLPGTGGGGSMKGWNLRMRVSRDGGATWAPSVQVTSKPSTGDLTGWHTAGLTADATGCFHPVWIDDRTGKPQLWTARVTLK